MNVSLSDDELLLLDGRCSPQVQKEVDRARARLVMQKTSALSPHLAAFVADVLSEARAEGELTYRFEQVKSCSLCRAKPEPPYVLYKSGYQKGLPNYNRPRFIQGIELARRFVRIENHISLGGCQECVTAALPEIKRGLADIPAQVPKQLASEGRPVWVKYGRRRCRSCGWEGHEGEMRALRTLMGDRTFRGGCPACPNEQKPLGASAFEFLREFDVVRVEETLS